MKPTPSISSPVVPRSHRTASTNAPRPHALSKPELVEPRKRAASTNTLPARTSLKPRSVIPHSSETKKPEEVQKKELKAPSYNEDSILDQEIVQTRSTHKLPSSFYLSFFFFNELKTINFYAQIFYLMKSQLVIH